MKEFIDPSHHVVVLQRGDELHEQLQLYARNHTLTSAWVGALGATSRVTVGLYRTEEREYTWKEFEGLYEILSLSGNLSWVDGEPFWHIHGVFSGEDFQAVGGHVKELIVGATCELFITPLDIPMTRIFDDETGLKLLS